MLGKVVIVGLDPVFRKPLFLLLCGIIKNLGGYTIEGRAAGREVHAIRFFFTSEKIRNSYSEILGVTRLRLRTIVRT